MTRYIRIVFKNALIYIQAYKSAFNKLYGICLSEKKRVKLRGERKKKIRIEGAKWKRRKHLKYEKK